MPFRFLSADISSGDAMPNPSESGMVSPQPSRLRGNGLCKGILGGLSQKSQKGCASWSMRMCGRRSNRACRGERAGRDRGGTMPSGDGGGRGSGPGSAGSQDFYPPNLIPGEPALHDCLPVAGEPMKPMMYRRLSSRMTSGTITMRRAINATAIIHRRVVIRGRGMEGAPSGRQCMFVWFRPA